MKLKKKQGFTLIELLAAIVIIALLMIIAIPNIISTMNNSKKKALEEFAIKSINDALKLYENEVFSKVKPGTSNSDFKENSYGFYISINDLNEGKQNKYNGCVVMALPMGADNADENLMYIYVTDGEYMYKNVIKSKIKNTPPQKNTLPTNDQDIIDNMEAPVIPDEYFHFQEAV